MVNVKPEEGSQSVASLLPISYTRSVSHKPQFEVSRLISPEAERSKALTAVQLQVVLSCLASLDSQLECLQVSKNRSRTVESTTIGGSKDKMT